MGSLCGFSVKAQSSLNFNPFESIPDTNVRFRNIKLMGEVPSSLMPSERIISDQNPRWSVVPDTHIGHERVQIEECQQMKSLALDDGWFDTAQVENETLPFITDCDKLRINKEYYVMHERTEAPTGESESRFYKNGES